ncbi:MAG: D-lyxose/D-mannose family sugar isomerase [Verrucomicrobiae bacterium]|nr:D-lyxose/D-mannose family sugar isomerase [Verrucomicrobiae bacterium]
MMKRSEINEVVRKATVFYAQNGWHLPPQPRWDVTDFGLGNFKRYGLVLINLAEEKEYCEKLMYAQLGMTTPLHCHKKKKEDIIARAGSFKILLYNAHPDHAVAGEKFTVNVCGQARTVSNGETIRIQTGERVTLMPGVYHEFYPDVEEAIIGEVSTANDDLNDNFFVNPDVGRYPEITEDEPPMLKLLSDK